MNCASASGRTIARADAASLGAVVPVTESPAMLDPFALLPLPLRPAPGGPPSATQHQWRRRALHPRRVTPADNGVTNFGTSRAGGLIMASIAGGGGGES